jgi:hypothetical protein
MNITRPDHLSYDAIENVEKLTLRWIFQSILDFGMEAYEVFLKSPDSVKDIAEDITREILDRLAGHNFPNGYMEQLITKKPDTSFCLNRPSDNLSLLIQRLKRKTGQQQYKCRKHRC